ncbi:MAG: family 10 glycosylhydrolase, partial [Gemmatimonadota bacterium]|nr:family 10 glycosylhydrolase [Gemmatimonadota bacterium]
MVVRTAADTLPPPIPREFRAVWVATVGNMDWPSRPGLSTEQQQAEMIALLDRLAALHMNAVVLQVRPAADALYQSSIEPWSDVLTGEMGRAPEPFYDPLAFALTEAHKRGLEMHAWINPYRAKNTSTKTMSDGHI